MNRQHLIVGVGLALSLVACITACVAWANVQKVHGEMRELRAETAFAKGKAPPCAASARLGDRMNTIARRFAGVWYAGKSGNVELAEYEIHELEEVIEDIELLRPIENGVDVFSVLQGVANSQLHDLRAALRADDPAAFDLAYETTMAACNSCHNSAGHPFIVITKPNAPPVHNRAFHPVETSVKVPVQAAVD